MRYAPPMSDDAHPPRWPQRRLPGFDYADTTHPYFVTIRALPRTAPFSDQRLARLVLDSLHWLRTTHDVVLYAYCLMPDHLHLLLQLGRDDHTLGQLISSFKRFTTHQSWPLGYAGALWQPRFHDHVVRRAEDGERMVRYILHNPVRRGLVDEDGAYPYAGTPDPII